MKRYLVELEAEEREAVETITRKGSHRSQNVVNALVLLNCDEGEFTSGARPAGRSPGCCGSARAGWTESRSGLWRTASRRRSGTGRVVVLSTFARRTANSRRVWSRSVAAIRPRGARSGRYACWRIARWNSATSTASRTRQCGAC